MDNFCPIPSDYSIMPARDNVREIIALNIVVRQIALEQSSSRVAWHFSSRGLLVYASSFQIFFLVIDF
jgi:hypothetical protein